MTIEEAQQLVEVWDVKHPAEHRACGNREDGTALRATATETSTLSATMQTALPDPQVAAALGRRFWELLAEANRRQVDLTAALTETLALLNATCKR